MKKFDVIFTGRHKMNEEVMGKVLRQREKEAMKKQLIVIFMTK